LNVITTNIGSLASGPEGHALVLGIGLKIWRKARLIFFLGVRTFSNVDCPLHFEKALFLTYSPFETTTESFGATDPLSLFFIS
jgi:hypothetical protein